MSICRYNLFNCIPLQVFVHISTAYCHLEEKVLEEKAYEPPADPMQIIRTCELIDEELLNSMSKKYINLYLLYYFRIIIIIKLSRSNLVNENYVIL